MAKAQTKKPTVRPDQDEFIRPSNARGRSHKGRDGPPLEKIKQALFDVPEPGIYFFVTFTLRLPYKSGQHWVIVHARINGIERAGMGSGRFWNLKGVLYYPRTPTSKKKTTTCPLYSTYYDVHTRRGTFVF